MEFWERYQNYLSQTEEFLTENLSEKNCPRQEKLASVMGYSLLAGGKRLRPVLVLEFCRVSGTQPEAALPFAAALDMIHTYSLIHDDLPCMDDDDLRRGKPSSHKVFGEAMAVLAGDALLTRAFELVTEPEWVKSFSDWRALEAAHLLAVQAGMMGMVGGQVLDMEGETTVPDLEGLLRLQRLKTGALIRAAALGGCILGGGTQEQRQAADAYASALGLAFQIRDDVLDVEGDEALLGKKVGMDAERGKASFPSTVGLPECRQRINELTAQATQALTPFWDTGFLIELAQTLAQRQH